MNPDYFKIAVKQAYEYRDHVVSTRGSTVSERQDAMGRYDYSDPGQDPEYCDGLAPADSDDEYCAYCTVRLASVKHYPYCSTHCAVLAESEGVIGG